MSYPSLMVHLQLGRSNAGLLSIAAGLAERFDSSVIGIAARQPLQLLYGDGYVSGDLYEADLEESARELKDAELEFRTALAPRVATIEWRSSQTYAVLADYLAGEARCADLILTHVAFGDAWDAARIVDNGALVMQAGRPVLLVPQQADALTPSRMLIAWKDTPETRRAVTDALPLLKRASHVKVVELAPEDDLADAQRRVQDVVGWLKRHGIDAEGSPRRSTRDDAAALHGIAQDMQADVLVAGAYGHSRLREWALGGVTRDLLLNAERCTLISH